MRPVAYILDWFPQLSETFVENEIRAMCALGDDVVVASIYPPAPELAGETILGPDRLFYRPGPAILAAHFLVWTLRRPAAMARNLRRVFSMRSTTMLRGVWSAPWMASRFRRLDVRHVHADFALDSTCAGRTTADLLRLPFTFTLHAHELYTRNRTLCTRVDFADTLVTVCQYNIDELVKRCPSAANKAIEIVYCGVDPAQFQPGPASTADTSGPISILSVGRLVEQKGFADLIDAVAILTKRGRDVDLQIVGQGPLLDSLTRQVADAGVEGQVTFLGPRPPAQVADLMAAADIFVLACVVGTDENRDSMPVVLKEAMASGVPVVGTDEVAIPEMVDASVGRLARPNDPDSLADAIESLIDAGPDQRRALGGAGRARVADRFNVVTETARLREIFAALSTKPDQAAR